MTNKQKLIYGLLYSLKSFCNKLNPKQLGEFEQTPIQTITTPDYRIHYYETLSGLRFVLVTDVSTSYTGELLKHAYTFYANYIVRNPENEPGCIPEDTATFLRRIDHLIEAHPNFSTGLPQVSESGVSTSSTTASTITSSTLSAASSDR